MPTLTKIFSMQEAAAHNTKDDCWVVIDGKHFNQKALRFGQSFASNMERRKYILVSINGVEAQDKVYDVTTYLDEHPGGDDVLLTATGKDATEEFEDAGHSQDARDLMEKYFVGELDPSAAPIPEPEQEKVDELQKIKDLPPSYWAIPVAVAGISIIVGFLYLRKKGNS